MRSLIALFLVGCGAIDLVPQSLPCENVDLNAEPYLIATEDGEDVLISRLPVFVGDADVFSPTFDFEGSTIFVYEGWNESEDSVDDVCRSATIRLVDPPQREFTVEWYLGDSVIPDYRFTFKSNDL